LIYPDDFLYSTNCHKFFTFLAKIIVVQNKFNCVLDYLRFFVLLFAFLFCGITVPTGYWDHFFSRNDWKAVILFFYLTPCLQFVFPITGIFFSPLILYLYTFDSKLYWYILTGLQILPFYWRLFYTGYAPIFSCKFWINHAKWYMRGVQPGTFSNIEPLNYLRAIKEFKKYNLIFHLLNLILILGLLIGGFDLWCTSAIHGVKIF